MFKTVPGSIVLRVIIAWCALAVFGASVAQSAGVDDLITFQDVLRPGSDEAYRKTYKTLAWSSDERAIIQKHFQRIYALAPGLLYRGASDHSIALYRVDLPTYAKGGVQLIVIDKKAFLYPNYSTRVILHELVHTADSYGKLSGSEAFRALYEPKILAARNLLRGEGLTPSTAAALPLGERRKYIERLIREKTGLPSAYAARNLSECLAEVMSFWLLPEYKYTPPAQMVEWLTPIVKGPGEVDPLEVQFRKAKALIRSGRIKTAIAQFSRVIRADPGFYQAYSMRGYLYLKINKNKLAVQDLKQAHDLISPYQSDYGFYDSEWRRVANLVKQ